MPAASIREAYPARWTALETTFGEDKATITGAGKPGIGPRAPLWLPAARPAGSLGLADGHPAGRAGEAATLRSEEAAARALRRKDARPVTADEESFTAAWHHAVRSMETTQVTAASSLAALAAAGDAAARAHLHALNIPGRNRHSPREQKHARIPAHVSDQAHRDRDTRVIVYAPGRH